MISVKDGVFALETAHTGYYLAQRGGLVENLHYGSKIHLNREMLSETADIFFGGDILYGEATGSLSLHQLCLEFSPMQKGDFRAESVRIRMPNGSYTSDAVFQSARTHKGCVPPNGLPGALGGEETLLLDFALSDGVSATLIYTVYPDCDVITRRLSITNNAKAPIVLEKLLSYQLDLPETDFVLSTFTGSWIRERHETRTPLTVGAQVFGSTNGLSSALCNPFFMLAKKDATEFSGGVYGMNLLYSGSHFGCAEVSVFGKTRIMAGIQPEDFSYTLAPGESFETPEAVLTYSPNGKNGMSANMHDFVNNHILRGEWAHKERPILINNWEATYFDFNEAKLLKIARAAAKMGIELFVLDDGWFGARNSDTMGLGDYTVNRKKLPSGLEGLAEKINALGMSFGLWFEPENVNPNSDLYRAHPDWVVATPGIAPGEGRHQLVLDLCREDVQNYIIENVNRTLQSAAISYVKWDMNRPLTDNYSSSLSEQGRFSYTFVRGLYRILSAIMSANPTVLFEGCASGGNRFDLGMLCYFSQIWPSDDTDTYERQLIQTGTSYGYPQSVMSCHVSAVPNHQTARSSPIESRFDVAAFGILGYELDLSTLSPAEQKAVTAQIAYYKAHRALLQYGRFLRLKSPFTDGCCQWMVVSNDKKEALLGEFLHLLRPNTPSQPLHFAGLDAETQYTVTTRRQFINIKAFGSLINFILPVRVNADGVLLHTVSGHYMLPCEDESYTAYGDALMLAGIKQKQSFTGNGYTPDVRLMPDWSARIYYIKAVD